MLKKCTYLILLILLFACSEKEKSFEQNTKTEEPIPAGKILKFGTVTKNFLNIENQFKPFDNYIAKQISDFGYGSAKTILTSSLEELKNKANQGEVDIYSGSLYSTIYLNVNTDLEPVLKRSIDNEPFLSTIIFTKKTTGIESLKDLLGKVIVFEHEFSTSGYYYPKTYLLKEGYKLVKVENPSDTVDKNSIGYCFSGHDENSVAWVINEHAVAAATDEGSFSFYSGVKKNELRILHKSKKYLRFIVSINKNLSDEIKEKVITAFINYPHIARNDPKLKKYYDSISYEPIKGNEYSIIKKDLEDYLLD